MTTRLQPRLRVSPAGDPGQPPARPRVLLVEDDVHNAVAFKRFLEFEGLTADIVATIEDALCALGKAPYDVIVTDLLLRDGESGQELQRRLRRTRLIVLSGHVTGLARATGFDVALRKPCDPDTLLRAILDEETT